MNIQIKNQKNSILVLLLLMVFSTERANSDTPFPARVLQVPVCAANASSMQKIANDLNSMKPLKAKEAENYIKEQIEKGHILSSQKLLGELKEQYRKGAPNSSSEILIPLQQRINYLEARTQSEESNNSIYNPIIMDVTEQSVDATIKLNIEKLRKICNGGQQKAKHPFKIFEFIVQHD